MMQLLLLFLDVWFTCYLHRGVKHSAVQKDIGHTHHHHQHHPSQTDDQHFQAVSEAKLSIELLS